MLFSALFLSTAFGAAPLTEAPGGRSGNLPGAADYPAGEWTVETSAQSFILPSIGGFGAARGQVAYAFTDAFSLSVDGGAIHESHFGRYGEANGVFNATARLQTSIDDTLRVATWLRPRVFSNVQDEYPVQSSTALGVSVEGGGEHTRLDISLPVACLETFVEVDGETRSPDVHMGCFSSWTEMPEIGVSALFGSGHRVRVSGIYPTVSYGHFGERVFGEVGVGLLGVNGRLGVRF